MGRPERSGSRPPRAAAGLPREGGRCECRLSPRQHGDWQDQREYVLLRLPRDPRRKERTSGAVLPAERRRAEVSELAKFPDQPIDVIKESQGAWECFEAGRYGKGCVYYMAYCGLCHE